MVVILLAVTCVSCSDLNLSGKVDSLTKSDSRGVGSSWSGWQSPMAKAQRVAAGGVTTKQPAALIDVSDVNVHWHVPLPGGTSSPTIWHDQIFVTYETPQLQVGLICLDSAGSIAWEQPLARATGPTHHKTGHAAATPATNGELVYASFGQAGLFCLNLNGQLVWQAGEHHVKHEWGHASSPLLAGETVIQLADGQEGSFIAAYEASSGKRIWKTARESNGCWSSPILFRHPDTGREWIVVNGSGRNSGPGEVTGYDLETGVVAWSVAGTSSTPAPTAVVFRDRILSASGNNGPILSIQIDQLGQASETWRNAAGGPYVPTGLIVGEVFVQLEDSGKLTGYSAMTGKRHWVKRFRGPFTASLTDLGDKILLANENGELTFVSVGPDACTVTATHSVGAGVLATPAHSDGQLFVRTEDGLVCLASAVPKSELAGDSNHSTNHSNSETQHVSSSPRTGAEGSVIYQPANE